MKKLLIALSVLLLLGAGYFTYDRWEKKAALNAWSFVSEDASFVLETTLLEDYEALSQLPVWQLLQKTAAFKQVPEGLAFLDTLNGQGGLSTLFQHTPALISAHNVAADGLGFLFVVDIQNISQNTFVGASIGKLKQRGFRVKKRKYRGYDITEISKKDKAFTCIFYRNYLLASFTPYLIEDAIRTIENELPAFKTTFAHATGQQGAHTPKLFVNYKKTSELLSGLSEEPYRLPLLHGSYDLSLDSSFMEMSGWSAPDPERLADKNPPPASFSMAEIVPENTAYLCHISSSDFKAWKPTQFSLFDAAPAYQKMRDSLQKNLDFDLSLLFDLIDDEMGFLQLEPSTANAQSKMTFLKVQDPGEAIKFFNQLSDRIARTQGDTVYAERYSANEIRYLPIPNFPQTLFGTMASGYEICFYVNYRNYILFSNNLQELKSLLNDIQDENTWGKSLRMNTFFQQLNEASNVSVIVNVPRAQSILLDGLKPKWKHIFKKDLTAYEATELVAFQMSYQGGQYFTNATFSQPKARQKGSPRVAPRDEIKFANELITKPFLVKTHAYKAYDLMVQDSAHTLYYFDKNRNIKWSHALESQIISPVFPVDYYKNGKIQYAFATQQRIHLWDRTGQPIPGYPKEIPGAERLAFFNVIDYDQSRDYRFAISDANGLIFLTDKDLNPLTGWKPKDLKRRSLLPLDHQRIGNKDFMVSLQADGKIHLMNRRSEPLAGFPFDTQHTLDNAYLLSPSNRLENSKITVLSQSGEVVEVSLNGEVSRREQLLKGTQEATFRLIPDLNKKSYIIVKKEANSYFVLDDKGQPLFQKDYLSATPVGIQYYQLGAGRDLIIFIDTSHDALYIYNRQGALITGQPLSASQEVSLLYTQSEELQIFSSFQSRLLLYSIRF